MTSFRMRFHARLHRLFRAALPGRIRRLRGREMETTFLAVLRRERSERGWFGVAAAWWHESRDLLRTGVTLRRRDTVAREDRRRIEGEADGRREETDSGPGGDPSGGRGPDRSGGRGSILDGWIADLRHSLRMVAKTPQISALLVVILALGIGLNTAVFSLLEATVLRPFHYTDADRIVEIVRGSHQRFSGPFTYRAFEILRDGNDIFEAVAGFRDAPVSISIGGTTERATATEATSGLFDLLDVAPVLGRPFTPEDEGAGQTPAVIIAHQVWEERFGSDPGILGRTIRVDGTDRTIVGVMPPGFTFYQASSVWLPLPVDAISGDEAYRFAVLGRLPAGVTLARARAGWATYRETIEPLIGESSNDSQRLRRNYPLTLRTLAETSMPAGVAVMGGLLQSVAAFVLLVVCANLTTLLLARGVARQPEIAVRRALGAPRTRLVRQLLTENAVLAVAGATAGVFVAFWGHGLLLAAFPSRLLVGIEFLLDGRVLTFAAALAIFTVLAAGMLPAIELSRLDVGEALRDQTAGATGAPGARRRRSRLAVVQITLSLVLLIGASLTMRSMFAFDEVDPGFDAENVFSVLLAPQGTSTSEEPSLDETTRRVIERLEAAPGIEAVGWRSFATPEVIGDLRDRLRGTIGTRNGPSILPAREVGRTYSDDYFRTMGLRLLRGRAFDEIDRPGTPPVAVVSRRAAQVLFSGEDAVGKEIRVPGSASWITVVGVVSDVVDIISARSDSSGWGVRTESRPDVYLAASQFEEPPSNQFWVRPAVDQATLARLVRNVVAEVDPDREVTVRTVWNSRYEPGQEIYRLVGRILMALGLIALLLSALGSYSVISYSWACRAREVGVRMALGATTHDVFGMVLREGQKLALAGVLAGTLISAVLYRIAAGLFFGVSPWDPVVYAGVALLLLSVAAAAGLGPARRATRTNPVETLRRE